jgi:hypothetical protein
VLLGLTMIRFVLWGERKNDKKDIYKRAKELFIRFPAYFISSVQRQGRVIEIWKA